MGSLCFLEEIARDNESGSTELLDKLTAGLVEFAAKTANVRKKEFAGEMLSFYNHMKSFSVIFHFVNELFLHLEKADDPAESAGLRNFIMDYSIRWQNADERIFSHILDLGLPTEGPVLVHSRSGRIGGYFRQLSGQRGKAKVYQTVSHPSREGIGAASVLKDLGFDVSLIEDADATRAAKEVRYGFLGADSISGDSFTNKKGSLPIALALKHFGKSLYVLADSRKLSAHSSIQFNNAKETSAENARVSGSGQNNDFEPEAVTGLFESVPNELVSSFILETGVVVPGDTKKTIHSVKISKLWYL